MHAWISAVLVIILFRLEGAVPLHGLAQSDSAKCRPDRDGPSVARSAYPRSDTSAYRLPYAPGRAYPVWRTTSHFTRSNGGVGLYAIDIGMPIGTLLHASRAGVVVAARDSFPDGNDTDLQENYLMVKHIDGTVSRYIHLTRGGVLVEIGDTVRQGQAVARSGNSGQTGGPHLHFDVQACGPNLPPAYNQLPCGRTVAVTFRDAGPNRCGLVPGRSYRAAPPTDLPKRKGGRTQRAPEV